MLTGMYVLPRRGFLFAGAAALVTVGYRAAGVS